MKRLTSQEFSNICYNLAINAMTKQFSYTKEDKDKFEKD